MYHNQEGQLSGLLVDFWRKWSEKMDIPIRFKLVPWRATLTMVKGGGADIHSGLYMTPERGAYLDFSDPFYHSRSVLAIYEGYGAACADVYETQRIGYVDKTTEEDFLRQKHPESNGMSFQNETGLIQGLVDGIVGGILVDLPALKLISEGMQPLGEISICENIYERDLHAAVRKGDEDLLELVNVGFAKITQAERETIIGRWFVEEQSDFSFYWRLALFVSLFVLVAFGVFKWSSGRSENKADE